MPFPSTRVIHPNWSAHHQPTAEGGMTGVGTLTRAGTGPKVRDQETGQVTDPEPVVIAAGVTCRIRADRGTDRPVEVGEQEDRLRTYLVAIPAATAAPRVNDVFTVTVCANDPSLIGRPLKVLDVTRGTEQFERDLVCSDEG